MKASPNAEQLPVSSEAGIVSWEQPEFGLSNGLSSSGPSNPAVKQAHGEAEPVQREDGRQLTGARKTSPAWATGQRSLISEGPARGKKGFDRCHAFWSSMPSAGRSCPPLLRGRASCSKTTRPRSCVAFRW